MRRAGGSAPTGGTGSAGPGSSPAAVPGASGAAPPAADPHGGAQLLFTGGQIYRPGSAAPQPADVAVAGGRITAIGPAGTLRGLIGNRTEVIDASRRLLLPGFTDAHVHPGAAALEQFGCNLVGLRGPEQYLAAVSAFADEHPDGWIYGGGWVEESFRGGAPEPGALDRAAPGRPVYLLNADHHSVWASSAALAFAGIQADTPDPPDGRISRTADGALTGVLHEGAMDLLLPVRPEPDAAMLRSALLFAQDTLHSYGIVGWQDALVGRSPLLPDFYQTYCDADAEGELTARVVGAQWWDRYIDAEDIPAALAVILRRRDAVPGRRFHAGSVKLMLDGVCEAHTAALLAPYLPADRASAAGAGSPRGRHASETGIAFLATDLLNQVVSTLHGAGLQVHFHALGDRAVRMALDAVAEALNQQKVRTAGAGGGPGPQPRHHLAHLQVVHPRDVPRFAALGVTANCQALWACDDLAMRELTAPYLGPERTGWQYPFAGIADAGGRLAMGSDWPVTTPDPMQIVATAVTRVPIDEPERAPFLPQQRLSLAQALTAATAGSAYLNGRDAELAVGADADLVLLDGNPFALPPAAIGSCRADVTVVAGDVVHRRG